MESRVSSGVKTAEVRTRCVAQGAIGAFGGTTVLALMTLAINASGLGYGKRLAGLVGRRAAMGAVLGGSVGAVTGWLSGQTPSETNHSATESHGGTQDSTQTPASATSLTSSSPESSSSHSSTSTAKEAGGTQQSGVASGDVSQVPEGPITPILILNDELPDNYIGGEGATLTVNQKGYQVLSEMLGGEVLEPLPECPSHEVAKTVCRVLLANAQEQASKRREALETLVDEFAKPEKLEHLIECAQYQIPLKAGDTYKKWVLDQLVAAAMRVDPDLNPADVLENPKTASLALAASHAVVALVQQGRADEIPGGFELKMLDLRGMTYRQALKFLRGFRHVEQVSSVSNIFLPDPMGMTVKQQEEALNNLRACFSGAKELGSKGGKKKKKGKTFADVRLARATLQRGQRRLKVPTEKVPAPKIDTGSRLHMYALPTVQLPCPHKEGYVRRLRDGHRGVIQTIQDSGMLFRYAELLEYRNGSITESLSEVSLKSAKGGNSFAQVSERLFIGSEFQAADIRGLQRRGISVIVNLPGDFHDSEEWEGRQRHVSCSFLRDDDRFEVIDDVHVDDNEGFDVWTLVEEIEERIESGEKILLHDQDGITSCATVAIAYIMKAQEKSFEEALAQVRGRRPRIQLPPVHEFVLRQSAEQRG